MRVKSLMMTVSIISIYLKADKIYFKDISTTVSRFIVRVRLSHSQLYMTLVLLSLGL